MGSVDRKRGESDVTSMNGCADRTVHSRPARGVGGAGRVDREQRGRVPEEWASAFHLAGVSTEGVSTRGAKTQT